MGESKIEWTDTTWNPLRGCTRVSEGCRHCYAEQMASRFCGPGQPYEGLATRGPARWTGEVRLVEDKLDEPLRWRRGRRVFVNSMSDLFHESAPDGWIDRVFAVMALAERHTFQILTKRPERMSAYADGLTSRTGGLRLAAAIARTARGHFAMGRAHELVESLKRDGGSCLPLPNVWLGVSVEDQETADERIPHLLSTPAAVRFVSAEPLLGPVDVSQWMWSCPLCPDRPGWEPVRTMSGVEWFPCDGPHGLDWIIVGGESGPGARPCDVAWLRSIVRQCAQAGVPVFVKQLGADPVLGECGSCGGSGRSWIEGDDCKSCNGHGDLWLRLRDRKGSEPSEWPADLRVRQMPGGAS